MLFRSEAKKVANSFEELGERLDMDVVNFISDGSKPIGRGIGPALEARDVLRILESRGGRGPQDLKEKVLKMSNILLNEVGYEGNAEEILETGRAYEKMKEIIEAQRGHIFKSEEIEIGKHKKIINSEKEGKVRKIHNFPINEIARTAGCPKAKKAGVYLHKSLGDSVVEGDKLFTIYSENKNRLTKASKEAKKKKIFEIGSSREGT